MPPDSDVACPQVNTLGWALVAQSHLVAYVKFDYTFISLK